MGQGMTALQNILNGIAQLLARSGQDVYAVVSAYVAAFALLSLLWVLYQLAFGGRRVQMSLGLCLRLILVLTAIHRWPWFLQMLQEEGIWLGLLATGNRLHLEQFLDPGALVRLGIESGGVLWQAYVNNMSWTLIPIAGVAYLLAWLAYVCAFMVMAYKVFWWQVELLLMGLSGMVLLPSLVFRPTTFVASGVLSYAANAFVRFFLGSLLAGLLWNVLPTLTTVALPLGQVRLQAIDLKIQEAVYAVGLAWTMATCFLAVNRMAGVLTSGVPGMAGGQSVGSFVHMVTGAGAALLTAGGTAAYGALGAGRAVVAGGQAVQGMAAASAHIPSTASLGAAARALYGGAQAGMHGGAQATLGQLMQRTSAVTQAAQRQSLRQLMQGRGTDVTFRGTRP